MRSALSKNRRLPSARALLAALFFLASFTLLGAEYQGQNVDGPRYCGFVRSLTTGNYYPVSAVFEREHADVRLGSGKRLDLTLEEQTIEDPEEVLATDPRGGWWALSIDGLDELPDGSHPLTSAESAVAVSTSKSK